MGRRDLYHLTPVCEIDFSAAGWRTSRVLAAFAEREDAERYVLETGNRIIWTGAAATLDDIRVVYDRDGDLIEARARGTIDEREIRVVEHYADDDSGEDELRVTDSPDSGELEAQWLQWLDLVLLAPNSANVACLADLGELLAKMRGVAGEMREALGGYADDQD